MTEKQQFNVYLPPALIRKVKHAAIEKDQSLSLFVEESLIEHLRGGGIERPLDIADETGEPGRADRPLE